MKARQPVRRALQSLLGVDHAARREPILTAPVHAKFEQLGRRPHGTHHRIELLAPVAVPVREHRKVAVRDRRLPLRDRVQCEARVGDDPLAVAPTDLAMLFNPPGLAAPSPPPPCRANALVLCFPLAPSPPHAPVFPPPPTLKSRN